MPSGRIILALLGGAASSAFFVSTAMATMASVPAMPEHVHGDKGDGDQAPEPVFRYPIHETCDSLLSYKSITLTEP